MISALTAAFTALIGFFTDTFALLTDADIVPWITFGLGVAVLSICIKFFKDIVWGI
jgi:hypothetical protein